MKESGIKRVSISLDGENAEKQDAFRKLNFTSTLCAAKVPEGKINEFIEKVNGYKGVTHNYL